MKDMAAMTAEALTWLGLAWIGGNGERVKQLNSRNVSNKTAAVAKATVRTVIGSDGNDEMKAAAAAQAWPVIRRRQQRDNGDCGGNGGGANLTWLGGNGKMDRRQQKKK